MFFVERFNVCCGEVECLLWRGLMFVVERLNVFLWGGLMFVVERFNVCCGEV